MCIISGDTDTKKYSSEVDDRGYDTSFDRWEGEDEKGRVRKKDGVETNDCLEYWHA